MWHQLLWRIEIWNACYRTTFQAYSCSCFPCHCGKLTDNHKGPRRHLQEIERSETPTFHRYFWFFIFFWKQQIFLFPASQCGIPRGFPETQRGCPETSHLSHGDWDEENDWKPQVLEMHVIGQEIRRMLRRSFAIMQQRQCWKWEVPIVTLQLPQVAHNCRRCLTERERQSRTVTCLLEKWKEVSRTVSQDVTFM